MDNKIKRMLARGEPAVGTWHMIGHPVVSEILAQAGFDWIALDMEHGVMDAPHILSLMQAIDGYGCTPLCRIPINQPQYYKWALDSGAQGVIVPMIRTVDDAQRAVAAAKYPPDGIRGVGVCRVHGYGGAFDAYVRTANEETLVMLQIEHIDAVNCIEEICDLPGVDVVFVGPYDLSGTMGVMGEVHHPEVESAVQHVLDVAIARDVTPGLLIADPAPGEITRRIGEGFQIISIGLDSLMLVNAARKLMRQWDAAKGEAR
jgi:2-dehydro-3-deoxyglucarate aldolase